MYDLEPMAGAGFFLKNGKNICFHGVSITTRQGSSIHAEDVEGLEIHSFKTHKSHKDTYLIELANVQRAYIGSCFTNPKDEYFVHVEGEETEIISSDNSKR
ncbi:MAG: hypothetical protein Q8942_08030 [Bacillota bacterium]|nr:hypothetical protein [Bacillota bacterium]